MNMKEDKKAGENFWGDRICQVLDFNISRFLQQLFIFAFYGIPKIRSVKPTKEKNRWFVIRCAWMAAKLTAIRHSKKEEKE